MQDESEAVMRLISGLATRTAPPQEHHHSAAKVRGEAQRSGNEDAIPLLYRRLGVLRTK